MQLMEPEEPPTQPPVAGDPGIMVSASGAPTINFPPQGPLSPETGELASERSRNDNTEGEGTQADIAGSSVSAPIPGRSGTPEPLNHENNNQIPDQGTNTSTGCGVSNLFRLLDLVEDRSSGGIVEKVVIDQESLSKFINTLQPGSYKSVSDIDFKALDNLSIRPIGLYGSQPEIVQFLKEVKCLDDTCEMAMFKRDHQGDLISTLRSGLYLAMGIQPQSKTVYMVYWPEAGTWDDQVSAEAVSNTLRRNRETFMRFLTKLCDQTIALVSTSQAEAFVWERGVQNPVALAQHRTTATISRMEEYHVLELDEQDDDVIASPGFEISVDAFIRQIANEGFGASDMRLVGGEERIGLLTHKDEKGHFKPKRLDGKVSQQKLSKLIRSEDPERQYHLVLGSISPDSFDVLAANGLRERYRTAFENHSKSLKDLEDSRQSTKVEEKKQIENVVDQDEPSLREEIRHMVRREYDLVYPATTFMSLVTPSHSPERSALLYQTYKIGLDRISQAIRGEKIDHVSDSEFQTLKSKWVPLRDRLDANPPDSERDRVALVNGLTNPASVSPETENLLAKLWNTVTDLPARIAGSASTKKLSDPEFISQLCQWERRHSCLAPLSQLVLGILRKDVEKFAGNLISQHLEELVVAEKRIRYESFEKQYDCAFRESENRLLESLIHSVKQAMTPPEDSTPILCIDSIRYQTNTSSSGGRRPPSWLYWTGYTRVYVPPLTRYNIYPFGFTTHDRHQSDMDENHIPTPKIALTERFNFTVLRKQSIEFTQLVRSKCVLAISDMAAGQTCIYAADNVSLHSQLQSQALHILNHERMGGSRCIYALDQTTRFFAIVHGYEDVQLSLLRFDQNFTSLQRYRAPMPLNTWYKQRPDISAACFQTGRSELFLIDSSGGVHVVSISAEMTRQAPFSIDPTFANLFSTPDGSCLLAVVEGATPLDSHRLLGFHWDSSGLEEQLQGVEATNLPPSETPCVITRFYGKGRIHVVSLLSADNLVKSTILQVKQKTTEFAIRSINEGSSGGIQTINNSLIDCHLEPRQLVFASPVALPQAAAYFERLISTLRRTTQKPMDQELTTTIVSSRGVGELPPLESVSEFKLGSFIVELICLIPIHIAMTMDNKFMPLKDGIWDPDYESSLVGSTIEEINESLSFGWYESIFRKYMADKMVRVVSSMGEQSVGKSYCLNHFADTSFAGSAMRTTEGAWLSCTPTKDYLLVSLDFEGIQSTERSPQEDMLLVLFNTAISNLILFRNNFAVSRNIRGLFTSFELSAGTFDPVLNPDLFQSTLAIIIKDVTDADTTGIQTEFRLKFGEIVRTERKRNFISRLHRGKILITPWPVINSPEFYSLFHSIRERLEEQKFTHQTGGRFLHKLKTLMVNIKTSNWDSIEQSLASSRAHQLSKLLKMALSHGTASEGPLKNMDIDEALATSEDEPIFFVPEDYSREQTDPRVQSTEIETELKKQEEIREGTLKNLVQRCEPFQSSRAQMADSNVIDALQQSLDDFLERRLSLVELWINVNTNHLPQENVDIRDLNRTFDALKRDMRAAIRLCRSRCGSCLLECMRPHSHSGTHDCSTDHRCKFHCEVPENHSEPPPCGLEAGHSGRHMCNVNFHSCGRVCDLSQWAGCTRACMKPLDHEGDEHLCSAPSHLCGKPCDLRGVYQGPHTGKFDCPGVCQKAWNEDHGQHYCNSQPCPIACALCVRTVNNPPGCCSTDHFHGLSSDIAHLCGADHECSEECEADGICHIDFIPSEKTFKGKYSDYIYTRHEQVGKKLPCKVRIPQGEVVHVGPHNHDPLKNEHKCDAQCPGCKYYCTHPIAQPHRLHTTVHGSMTGSRWIIESKANEIYKLDEHRYASGDPGDSMFCNMLCVKQGRHAHIDFCRDASNHSQPLCEHIGATVEPQPDRHKDWVSHATYWERTGFEDPYGIGQRKEFAKCDARCADPAHGDPSECILPLFHAPKRQHPEPPNGYVSQDGHQFACINPSRVRQAYHVVFVVDNSGSMRCDDITPEPSPIFDRLKAERCDDRYGAVVSALYSFWKKREGTRVGSSSVVREDHYSVVVFDRGAEARVEDDWRLTTEQLVDKLIPQRPVQGYTTNFEAGIQFARDVIERSWNSQRAPIVVFLSDGGGRIIEQSIRDLCNLCVKLGQALAFYSISFGPDSGSDSLRLMVSVAEQVFRGASTDAKGAYLAQDPPCKHFSNTMTSIQLSNTFVRIANSLPKLRASVMNKTGASGRS